MKYIKTYESITKNQKNDLIRNIIAYLDEITEYEEDDYYQHDLDECPFINELNIIHQRESVDDIFYDVDDWNVSLEDFKITYKELLEEAIIKITKIITKNPELYYNWHNYIDGSGLINIPPELKEELKIRNFAKKYNL